MSKELIFESEYACLWYHPESKIIHHQIKKYVYGKNLQDLLLKGTELMKTKGAKKWLSDDRNNSALTQADSEWSLTVWFPATLKTGWKYWAIVQPEKMIGQISMRKYVKNCTDQGIITNLFSDPDEALKWLSEQ